MKTSLWKFLLLCISLLLAIPAAGVAAAPAADGPNLLDNPGFESPFVKQCCQTDLSIYLPGTPIDEVQVAHGWSGWWLQPDQDDQHPSSGGHPSWHRPEWREANCGSACDNRIHSGGNAQKYFTFFSVHDSGMFQQVSHGITPGTLLRFSVFMQGWSTNADYGLSDLNQNMGMRIGIDPFGGTNAFSPDVIWTAPNDTFDRYALYVLEATARSSTVTVFTRSAPGAGNQHNDIYIDDASLVAVSGGGSTGDTNDNPPPPPPPPPTPTPTEITGLRYVVVRGDNYYRISRRFGVSLSLLYSANRVTNPNILYVGTVLIIPGVTGPVDTGGNIVPTNPPPQPTVAPQDLPGAFSYVVVRGDNLYRLSIRFGVTIARIKQLNNLVADIIYIGQTLIIAP